MRSVLEQLIDEHGIMNVLQECVNICTDRRNAAGTQKERKPWNKVLYGLSACVGSQYSRYSEYRLNVRL